MKIEINKIITLGNNEEYLVVDKVEKDGKEYYYVAEVNEDETDIKDNYKIVCATYDDGNIYLDEVLGEDQLKAILPLFVKE
jgi:predicted RecB family nuclease